MQNVRIAQLLSYERRTRVDALASYAALARVVTNTTASRGTPLNRGRGVTCPPTPAHSGISFLTSASALAGISLDS